MSDDDTRFDTITARQVEIETRVQEYAKRSAEAFAEYIIDESETALAVETFDIDAVIDAIQALHDDGFRVSDNPNRDGKPATGFAHPALFDSLRRGFDAVARIDDGGSHETLRSVGVSGVEVFADAAMPDGTAVVVHPDAVAPMPPTEAAGLGTLTASELHTIYQRRPWLVKHPNGVIVVEVADELEGRMR